VFSCAGISFARAAAVRISSRLRKSPSAGFAFFQTFSSVQSASMGASNRIGRNVGSSAGFSATFFACA
jgi:hypothetical protein